MKYTKTRRFVRDNFISYVERERITSLSIQGGLAFLFLLVTVGGVCTFAFIDSQWAVLFVSGPVLGVLMWLFASQVQTGIAYRQYSPHALVDSTTTAEDRALRGESIMNGMRIVFMET